MGFLDIALIIWLPIGSAPTALEVLVIPKLAGLLQIPSCALSSIIMFFVIDLNFIKSKQGTIAGQMREGEGEGEEERESENNSS